MGWSAGDINLLLYINDGNILGWDHEWVQNALMVAVAMFRRMGLDAILEKTKVILYTPGFVWVKWG